MEKWFEYDWPLYGRPAQYSIDIHYTAAEQGYDTLLLVSCTAADKAAPAFNDAQNEHSGAELSRAELTRAELTRAELTRAEISTARRIEKSLTKKLDSALLIGVVEGVTAVLYYFYVAPNTDAVCETLDKLAIKQKKLNINYMLKHEPDWSTYFSDLYPDDAKYQTIKNEKLIDYYRTSGDNLQKVRRLTLITGFPSEQHLLMFREGAKQAGFALGDALFAQEYEMPHLLHLHILAKLNKFEIDSITTTAIRVCEAYNGILLNWTCPKVTK